jgi:hypothetical protein
MNHQMYIYAWASNIFILGHRGKKFLIELFNFYIKIKVKKYKKLIFKPNR